MDELTSAAPSWGAFQNACSECEVVGERPGSCGGGGVPWSTPVTVGATMDTVQPRTECAAQTTFFPRDFS